MVGGATTPAAGTGTGTTAGDGTTIADEDAAATAASSFNLFAF